MPFNITDTLNQALSIPIQRGTNAVVSSIGSRAAKEASSLVSNFGVANVAQKTAEALEKVVGQGNIADFDSMSRQIQLAAESGKIVAKDAGTGTTLGTVSTSQTNSSVFNLADFSKVDSKELLVSITSNLGEELIFAVTPTIAESQNVSYDPFTPIHHPGEILKYKGTSSRSWSVSGKLVSRNAEEATRNLNYINMIRSWSMPFYGEGTMISAPDLLGAPPPILTLRAYGANVIGPVKCVLESFNWTWPNDVDFLPAGDYASGEIRPFPVIIDVTLSLKESWSPAEFSQLDIFAYRTGNMPAAFSAAVRANDKTESQAPVPPGNTPGTLNLSQPTNLIQEGVNKMSSNLASNIPTQIPGWGREVREGAASAVNSAAAAVSKITSGGGGDFGGGGASGGW